MPTTYTHDVFGKQVYHKLTREQKRVIRRHQNLYRIGLHGPDILFYYMVSKNSVTQAGVKMHHEKAKAFFEQGAATAGEENDEALMAYLLGFVCHYALDTVCHPYVNQVAEKGKVSHTLLEKEYDRLLLQRAHRDPMTYQPSDAIVPRAAYVTTIHKVLPLIRKDQLLASLYMMKFLTNRMVHRHHEWKRRGLGALLRLSHHPKAMGLLDHFMTEEPTPGLEKELAQMDLLYAQALQGAPALVNELWEAMTQGKSLGEGFDRTYLG